MVKNFNNFKLKNQQIIYKGNQIKSYLLVAKNFGILTEKQLEAVRRLLTKKTDKLIKIHIKIKPQVALIQKPSESRMGKGKGKFKSYI
jgi:large subunit ribosomal protein L16